MSFFDSEKSDDLASAESFFAEVRNEKLTRKKPSVNEIASAESFFDELRDVQSAGPAVPGRPEKPPERAAEIEVKNPADGEPAGVPDSKRVARGTEGGDDASEDKHLSEEYQEGPEDGQWPGAESSSEEHSDTPGSTRQRLDDQLSGDESSLEEHPDTPKPDEEVPDESMSVSSESSPDHSEKSYDSVRFFDPNKSADATMSDFKSFKMVVFARPRLIEAPDISALPIVISNELQLIKMFQKECHYRVNQYTWPAAEEPDPSENDSISFDYHSLQFALPQTFDFLLDSEKFQDELERVKSKSDIKDRKLDSLQLECKDSIVANVQALISAPMESKAAASKLMSMIYGAMYLDRFQFFKGSFLESDTDTTHTSGRLLAPAEILRQVFIMSDFLQRNFAFGINGSMERETVRHEIERARSHCLQSGIDMACRFQHCFDLAATWHKNIWKWFSKIAQLRHRALGDAFAIDGVKERSKSTTDAMRIKRIHQFEMMLKLRALMTYIDRECVFPNKLSKSKNLQQYPETVYKYEQFVFKNDLSTYRPVFASRHVKLNVENGVVEEEADHVWFSTSPDLLEQNYGVPPPGRFFLKFSLASQDNQHFFDGDRINYNPWLECLCRLSILNELMHLGNDYNGGLDEKLSVVEYYMTMEDWKCVGPRMAYFMFVKDPCFQSLWREMNQDPILQPQLQKLGVDIKGNEDISKSIESLFQARNLKKFSFDMICKIFLDYRHIKHILEDGKTLSCEWYRHGADFVIGRPMSFSTVGQKPTWLGVERIGSIEPDNWHAYFPHVDVGKITAGGAKAFENSFWQRLHSEYFKTPRDGLPIPFGIEKREKLNFTMRLQSTEAYTDTDLTKDMHKLFADMHKPGISLPKTLQVMSSAFKVTGKRFDVYTVELSVGVMVPIKVKMDVLFRYNGAYIHGDKEKSEIVNTKDSGEGDSIVANIVDMSGLTSEEDTDEYVYTNFKRVVALTKEILGGIPKEFDTEQFKCTGSVEPEELNKLKNLDAPFSLNAFFYDDDTQSTGDAPVAMEDDERTGLPDLEFFWANLIALGHHSTYFYRNKVQSTTKTSMDIGWPLEAASPQQSLVALKKWNRFFSPKLMDAPLKASVEYFCAAFKLHYAHEQYRFQLEDVLSKFSRSNMLSDVFSMAYQRKRTKNHQIASVLLEQKKTTCFTDLSHVSLFPEYRKYLDLHFDEDADSVIKRKRQTSVGVPRLIFKCDYFDRKTSSPEDDAEVTEAYKKLRALKKERRDEYQIERAKLVKILQERHNERHFGPRKKKGHDICLEQTFTRLRTFVGFMAQIDFYHLAKTELGKPIQQVDAQVALEDFLGIDAYQQRLIRDPTFKSEDEVLTQILEHRKPRFTRLVNAYKNLAAIIAEDVGCTWSMQERVLTLEERIDEFEKGMCRFQVRGEMHPMFRYVEKPNLKGMTMEQFQLLDAASQTGIKAYFWCKIFECRTNHVEAFEWEEKGEAFEVELTFKVAPPLTVRRTRITQSGLDLYRYEFHPEAKDQVPLLDRQSYFFPRQFADEFSTIDIVEPCANFCPMVMKSFDEGNGALFEGSKDEPPFDKLVKDRDRLGYMQDRLLVTRKFQLEKINAQTKRGFNQADQPTRPEKYDESYTFTHRVLYLDWEKMKKHNDPKMYSLFMKVETVLNSVDFLCDEELEKKEKKHKKDSKSHGGSAKTNLTYIPYDLIFCFDGRDFVEQYTYWRDRIKFLSFEEMQYNMDSIMRVPCWDTDSEALFFENTIDDTKQPRIRKLGRPDYDEDASDADDVKAADADDADGGFFLCRSIAEDVPR